MAARCAACAFSGAQRHGGTAGQHSERDCRFLYEIRAFWEDACGRQRNGQGRQSAKYWLTRQLENHVVSGADAVAVICEGLKHDLISRGVANEKITVSPNGVDLDLFGEAPEYDDAVGQQAGTAGKTVSWASLAAFMIMKVWMTWLPRFADASTKHSPDIHLLLVGGGPREKALKEQAEPNSTSKISSLYRSRAP